MLIDSHCHLNFPELYANLDQLLAQMKDNQVDYAMCIGTRADNLDQVVQIANSHDNLFASVGIHPDEDNNDDDFSINDLLKYTDNPKVIAIGETGLDYYRIDTSTPDGIKTMKTEQERFIKHIEAGKISNLPLVIHTRAAFADTIGIMKENQAIKCGAVMHCFTESVEEARQVLDAGFYISISGIVTFKNALSVQEMAKFVPQDRLLVETDAPYLAPVPFRGKTNHPALVRHTAMFLANLRGDSFSDLATYTSNNFRQLFSKFPN